MLGDPSALALAGFSSSVLMVNSYFAGIVPNLDWLCPLALLSGISLLSGSLFQFVNINTPNGTTFGFYGAFWLSVGLFTLFKNPSSEELADILAFVRVPLTFFTTYALILSFFVSKALIILFSSLEINLLCVIVGQFTGSLVVTRVGGCFGIICALSGFYLSASILLAPVIPLPQGTPLLKSFVKKACPAATMGTMRHQSTAAPPAFACLRGLGGPDIECDAPPAPSGLIAQGSWTRTRVDMSISPLHS